MGSRGSGYENGKNSIANAKDWDELTSALENVLGAKVKISQGMREDANFEVVKKGLQAIDKMVKDYPILKGNPLNLSYDYSNKFMNGMTAFGNLTYYSGFYKKDSPISFDSDVASFGHPKNMSEEQCLAHELGHYVEALMIKKMYPTAGMDKLSNLYAKDAGFTPLFDDVMKEMRSRGFTGTGEDLRKGISLYGKIGGWSEAGAEAIADVYSNGDKAGMVSKIFVDVLNKKLQSL